MYYASATQIATNNNITLASIVTDAIDKWIKNYEKNRHRHNLILYSDQISLRKILEQIDASPAATTALITRIRRCKNDLTRKKK